jgi:hypothetical protein
MAVIAPDEIAPGLVAFLDPEALIADERVCRTKDQLAPRSGPFVCFSADDEISEWAPITTVRRNERLSISGEWRSGGHARWRRDDQYLNDGANVWVGPHEAFAKASSHEMTLRSDRARVTDAGLAAIRAEVEAQRARRDRPCVEETPTRSPD